MKNRKIVSKGHLSFIIKQLKRSHYNAYEIKQELHKYYKQLANDFSKKGKENWGNVEILLKEKRKELEFIYGHPSYFFRNYFDSQYINKMRFKFGYFKNKFLSPFDQNWY